MPNIILGHELIRLAEHNRWKDCFTILDNLDRNDAWLGATSCHGDRLIHLAAFASCDFSANYEVQRSLSRCNNTFVVSVDDAYDLCTNEPEGRCGPSDVVACGNETNERVYCDRNIEESVESYGRVHCDRNIEESVGAPSESSFDVKETTNTACDVGDARESNHCQHGANRSSLAEFINQLSALEALELMPYRDPFSGKKLSDNKRRTLDLAMRAAASCSQLVPIGPNTTARAADYTDAIALKGSFDDVIQAILLLDGNHHFIGKEKYASFLEHMGNEKKYDEGHEKEEATSSHSSGEIIQKAGSKTEINPMQRLLGSVRSFGDGTSTASPLDSEGKRPTNIPSVIAPSVGSVRSFGDGTSTAPPLGSEGKRPTIISSVIAPLVGSVRSFGVGISTAPPLGSEGKRPTNISSVIAPLVGGILKLADLIDPKPSNEVKLNDDCDDWSNGTASTGCVSVSSSEDSKDDSATLTTIYEENSEQDEEFQELSVQQRPPSYLGVESTLGAAEQFATIIKHQAEVKTRCDEVLDTCAKGEKSPLLRISNGDGLDFDATSSAVATHVVSRLSCHLSESEQQTLHKEAQTIVLHRLHKQEQSKIRDSETTEETQIEEQMENDSKETSWRVGSDDDNGVNESNDIEMCGLKESVLMSWIEPIMDISLVDQWAEILKQESEINAVASTCAGDNKSTGPSITSQQGDSANTQPQLDPPEPQKKAEIVSTDEGKPLVASCPSNIVDIRTVSKCSETDQPQKMTHYETSDHSEGGDDGDYDYNNKGEDDDHIDTYHDEQQSMFDLSAVETESMISCTNHHQAALECLEILCVRDPSSVHEYSADGCTPLHLALSAARASLVSSDFRYTGALENNTIGGVDDIIMRSIMALLQAGSDPNATMISAMRATSDSANDNSMSKQNYSDGDAAEETDGNLCPLVMAIMWLAVSSVAVFECMSMIEVSYAKANDPYNPQLNIPLKVVKILLEAGADPLYQIGSRRQLPTEIGVRRQWMPVDYAVSLSGFLALSSTCAIPFVEVTPQRRATSQDISSQEESGGSVRSSSQTEHTEASECDDVANSPTEGTEVAKKHACSPPSPQTIEVKVCEPYQEGEVQSVWHCLQRLLTDAMAVMWGKTWNTSIDQQHAIAVMTRDPEALEESLKMQRGEHGQITDYSTWCFVTSKTGALPKRLLHLRLTDIMPQPSALYGRHKPKTLLQAAAYFQFEDGLQMLLDDDATISNDDDPWILWVSNEDDEKSQISRLDAKQAIVNMFLAPTWLYSGLSQAPAFNRLKERRSTNEDVCTEQSGVAVVDEEDGVEQAHRCRTVEICRLLVDESCAQDNEEARQFFLDRLLLASCAEPEWGSSAYPILKELGGDMTNMYGVCFTPKDQRTGKIEQDLLALYLIGGVTLSLNILVPW